MVNRPHGLTCRHSNPVFLSNSCIWLRSSCRRWHQFMTTATFLMSSSWPASQPPTKTGRSHQVITVQPRPLRPNASTTKSRLTTRRITTTAKSVTVMPCDFSRVTTMRDATVKTAASRRRHPIRQIQQLCLCRPVSVLNGAKKENDARNPWFRGK